MEDDYKKWLTQFRKGYIELCTLMALKTKGSMHGIALIRFFEDMDLQVNEGTLYPLLNRMEQNGWLESTWNMPTTSGHPKREYIISKKGEIILPKLVETYDLHHESIKKIKGIK
ncbi:transcriptional regulator, PadR-like family [Arcobacter nitrofigilis DSM 7299]|uniref:Transcriptional regulator, PadR-like family n=1 Tax=Arcobacter nitrofigilis (strain ATCC 33309 / DSM 7299 / CCUG 15893 / LMG 7604 / NCTC 12251 / CI) TaxID=572480 RepID=D5V0E2_ARCNC|nr:helix-turn-helix transcriptional regulator [Arcobacter nitrofigilis]ADG93754.1 transcriptional regulator, PadR-like family [Arcobacter nitrofigilis DSM 7299]